MTSRSAAPLSMEPVLPMTRHLPSQTADLHVEVAAAPGRAAIAS
ncbi:MAG: hypothetical protein RLO52_44410 [Sandaracinaceae bacterium]